MCTTNCGCILQLCLLLQDVIPKHIFIYLTLTVTYNTGFLMKFSMNDKQLYLYDVLAKSSGQIPGSLNEIINE